MIYNILTIKDVRYVKAAILNINSYHKMDKSKIFKLYLDEETIEFYETVKFKLINSDNVKTTIIKNENQTWQTYKIDIFKEYYKKDDYVILDADSIWHTTPEISKEKITFLNRVWQLKEDIPRTTPLINIIDGVNEEMYCAQMGFLSIPKKFHRNDLLNRWYMLNDKIYNCKDLDDGMRKQCEQLSINFICQLDFLNDIAVLKQQERFNDTNILHSLYFGCITGHDQVLKQHGWVE